MSHLYPPIFETPRLLLRPFRLTDASDVQRLAGAPEIADTTLNVPHPYVDGMAETWIGSHSAHFVQGSHVNYAVVLRGSETLAGSISLLLARQHQRAEMGYWLGVPFWNRGYMTEAAAAMAAYGFDALGLQKITASHFARNPASGRVMEKIGMTCEGVLRRHVLKHGIFEDLAVYGLLSARQSTGGPAAPH